jgi:hypothetical protein
MFVLAGAKPASFFPHNPKNDGPFVCGVRKNASDLLKIMAGV